MSVQAKTGMTVDAFLAWAEGRPRRYERIDGAVVAMSPERLRPAETKLSAQIALRTAVRAAEPPCRVLPDGMSVKIDAKTVFEPDALVDCGKALDPDTTITAAPPT